MPNPWTIIGWLLLAVLVVVVFAGLSTALDMRSKLHVVPTRDVPRGARDAAPSGASAPS